MLSLLSELGNVEGSERQSGHILRLLLGRLSIPLMLFAAPLFSVRNDIWFLAEIGRNPVLQFVLFHLSAITVLAFKDILRDWFEPGHLEILRGVSSVVCLTPCFLCLLVFSVESGVLHLRIVFSEVFLVFVRWLLRLSQLLLILDDETLEGCGLCRLHGVTVIIAVTLVDALVIHLITEVTFREFLEVALNSALGVFGVGQLFEENAQILQNQDRDFCEHSELSVCSLEMGEVQFEFVDRQILNPQTRLRAISSLCLKRVERSRFLFELVGWCLDGAARGGRRLRDFFALMDYHLPALTDVPEVFLQFFF